MKFYPIVLSLALASCMAKPEEAPKHSKKVITPAEKDSGDATDKGEGNKTDDNDQDKEIPDTKDADPKPDTGAKVPDPTDTVDPGKEKSADEIAKEKAEMEKAAALAKLERIPEGCTGKSSVTDKDVVLFNGEATKYAADSKSIALNEGWKIDGVWGNGRIAVETKRGQPAITFDKETFYHGFDITPASVGGQRKTFTMSGFDVYYDSTRTSDGKFGLRIIKPGENEGSGDNEKRSWFKLDPNGSGADADVANSVVNSDCKLVRFYTTKTFVDQKKVANRFIWEFMPNWDPADKIFIYKIVLKDFQWKS